MRAVIQRAARASVTIEGRIAGAIDRGLMVLVAVAEGDTAADGEWLAAKLAALRIFPDEEGRMNRSVVDIGGGILVVSQFTLFASTRKGTRPSFNGAAAPAVAIPLYEQFLIQVEAALGKPVARGEFGASMQVELVNDGPVTLIIDTRERA
ncbi:MAG TPA: D-aminoacyl-tRNA deacylase [Opitutaceae bacterium]